jgi:hypothetical protein
VARIRTIKPEFPQSESMGRVSRDARLLFVNLWTICDDHGRTRAHSRMLASLLFPYDEDAGEGVPEWLAELEKEGCIRRYEVDGAQYLQVMQWPKHQKIDRPSKPQFPGLDEATREESRDTRERSSEEGTKEGKGKGKENISRPAPVEPAPAAGPVLLTIGLNDGSEFPVTEAQAKEFADLYPAVNVPQQLRAMKAWAIANPSKRKTKTGILRFVNAWLAKDQDRGGSPSGNGVSQEPRPMPRLVA